MFPFFFSTSKDELGKQAAIYQLFSVETALSFDSSGGMPAVLALPRKKIIPLYTD